MATLLLLKAAPLYRQGDLSSLIPPPCIGRVTSARSSPPPLYRQGDLSSLITPPSPLPAG